MLPSTKASCCGIGSDLIKFSPISEKYAFIICAFSLSIKAKLSSVLLRGPIVLLRAERFLALLINPHYETYPQFTYDLCDKNHIRNHIKITFVNQRLNHIRFILLIKFQ